MGLEEQKLNEWFNGERMNGLVDFKVRVTDAAKGLTREQLCADVNAMNDAISAGKTSRLTREELDR